MKIRHVILGVGPQLDAKTAAVIVETVVAGHGHGVDDVKVTVHPGSGCLTWVSED